jgi:L-fuculose-phosphate aldolase
MLKTEQEHRQDIVEVGRLVWQRGWVASNDGNISVRLDEERVLCTPTATCKGRMTPEDLIVCDMAGRKLSGSRERTTEMDMHLAIYASRPDIHAVVHSHPPVSTGYAVAGRPLNLALLPEVVIGLGSVPLAEYGLPGTPELTRPLLPLIPNHDAILMGNHGVVCYAAELFQAYFRMETVEHFARVALVAELLGGPHVLPRREVEKLVGSRARYGVHLPSGAARPIAAEDAPRRDHMELTLEEIAAIVKEALKRR